MHPAAIKLPTSHSLFNWQKSSFPFSTTPLFSLQTEVLSFLPNVMGISSSLCFLIPLLLTLMTTHSLHLEFATLTLSLPLLLCLFLFLPSFSICWVPWPAFITVYLFLADCILSHGYRGHLNADGILISMSNLPSSQLSTGLSTWMSTVRVNLARSRLNFSTNHPF